MNSNLHSLVEPLERRITPAGAIVATLAGGILTITGDDASNILTSVLINGSGASLTPDASTTINGQAPGAGVVLTGPVLSLRADFGNGDDTLTINNAAELVLPNGASFKMGGGDNTLNLVTSLRIELGSLTVIGGDGADNVTINGDNPATSKVIGATVLNYGDGGSSTSITDMTLKTLSLSSGEGNDSLALDATNVTQSLMAAFGNGLSNVIDVSNATIGSLKATGYGLNNSDFEDSTITGAASFSFTAAINLDFNDVSVGGLLSIAGTKKESNSNTSWAGNCSAGSLTIKGGEDATMTVEDLATVTVAGDLSITAKHDDAQLTIDAAGRLNARNLTLISLGDDVTVTVADTTVATPSITLSGKLKIASFDNATYAQNGGTVSVPSGLVMTAGGSATVNVVQDSLLTTPLDVVLAAKTATAAFNLNGARFDARNLTITGTSATYGQAVSGAVASDLNLLGNFSLKSTVDVARFEQINGTADIAGAMTLTGRDDADFAQSGAAVTTSLGRLTITASQNESELGAVGQAFTVNGDVKVIGFTRCDVTLAPTAVSELRGLVTVKGGVEADEFLAGTNARFLKSVTIIQGGGDDRVDIILPAGVATVGGNLFIDSGSGEDDVNLAGGLVAGSTTILTGTGADRLFVDNAAAFTGSFSANLGVGDDLIEIAQTTGQPAPVQFNGLVTILGGDGNDTLLLGNSGGDANSRAAFNSALANKIDGGTGLNFFDDEGASFTGINLGTGIIHWTDPT